MAWFVGILIFSVIFSLFKVVSSSVKKYDLIDNKVIILNIPGTINFASARKILASLEEAESDPGVKGILLSINSPGGSVGSSQEIYSYLLKLKLKGIKIVSSFGDMAASGGYYIASASDLIVSNPGAITGSIGVIIMNMNFSELAQKFGIKSVAIKSGSMKDLLSPFRPITKDEEQYLQGMVFESYERFIKDILKGRGNKIKEDKLRKIADGRILSGLVAQKEGLVDVVGGMDTAKDEMKKLLGTTQVKFVLPKKNPLEGFLKEALSGKQQEDLLFGILNNPVLYYYAGGGLK